MKKAIGGIVVVALALAGCQSGGGGAQVDAGAPQASTIQPAPPNYRALIVAEAKRSFKDPYSIRGAEITAPAPGFVGLLNGGQRTVVCIRFNAKNSFGAYIGQQQKLVFFANGKMSDITDNIFAGCADRPYYPFPELENIK